MRELTVEQAGPPRVLACGPTGTGKTSSLATLNRLPGKGAIVAAEEYNIAPYFQMCKLLGLSAAPVYAASTFDETVEVLQTLAQRGIDWLGFDGISAASNNYYVEQFPKGPMLAKDPRGQWSVVGQRIIETAMLVRDGPWKFAVTTALPARIDDGSEISIQLDGQMANKKVPAWAFNGICHFLRPTLNKDGTQNFRVSFFQEGNRDAKGQFCVGEALLGVEAPDWYEIFKKAGRL